MAGEQTSTAANRPSCRFSFPDPDPDPSSSAIKVDDVTRMNCTAVGGIVYVRSADDIKHSLAKARAEGRRVAVRGTKHSMGGQCMAEDSIVIDMTKMCRMHFDSEAETVVCECGCTWADLILFLNHFGMSPRTMQSYSTFSVGGTLAVNGHGITTDFSLSECVESFRLIKADGQEVSCSRGADGEAGELFKLALGGYGLFGVMWEVTMRVDRNSRMDMEALHLRADEFTRYFAAAQASGDVVMKLARLNILDTNNIDFFVFRRSHDEQIRLVSKLDTKPREMSWQSRLMYKWLMPVMKEVRYAIEKKSGTALDWGNETERNHMLHESAVPISQLYEPLFQVDDTFLLQEYFCPRSQFESWISRTRPIYKKLSATTEVVLLNTTIRFVERDMDTFLPYAQHEEGMFAFVLYYRLPRTALADAKMQEFHDLFVKETLALKGSFYLPYRCHYSHEQLEEAYPQIKDFFMKKEMYDPLGLFDNLWFRHYGSKYLSQHYRASLSQPVATSTSMPSGRTSGLYVPEVPSRRANAFRDLLSNPFLRRNFKDGFLTQIFNVMDNEALFRMMVKAARDPENRDDIEIYRALQRQLRESGGVVTSGRQMWKQLNQVSAQKAELTREVCSVVSHLGKFGQLHDLLSIGDPGRTVLSIRKALHMQGQCWVAHDTFSDDLPAVIERGSLDPVGADVHWQLLEAGPFKEVPDNSADLVTMMQGLHHIPQQNLPRFLTEVVRVLRPGGLFIVREHDASPSLMPMLDLAHSVFNAVMGVTDKEEQMELRAFRSLSEWRKILESTGLEDSMLFEMEPYDPTVDEMMCFYKPPLHFESASRPVPSLAEPPSTVQLPEAMASFMETAPQVLLRGVLDAIDGILNTLPAAVAIFKERMKAFSSGQQLIAQSLVDQAAEPILKILQNLRPLVEHVDFTGPADSGLGSLVPSEVLLLVPALMQKVQNGKASANEMFAASVIKDILDTFQGQRVHSQKTQEVAVSVTKEEVEGLLRKLLEAYPQFQEANALEAMGFPKRATQVFLSKMGSVSSVSTMADLLSTYLDEEAWIEFRAALLEAVHDRVSPSADDLFRPETTWARALRAFLGSQHVHIRTQQLVMCNYVGLEKLPPLYQAAQALRRSQQTQQSSSGVVAPAPVRSQEEAERKRNLQRALDGLTPGLQDVEMAEGQQHDICNVAEIASASFGYFSLTAAPKDVTEDVRRMLQNGKLRLQNVNLCRTFGVGGAADGFRRVATGNTRTLRIRYRSKDTMAKEDLLPRVTAILERLRSSGWTEDVHGNDGEYTWYKLNEWMQVEILQIFGQSLEREPWYRFPYVQFMKVYFDVLFQESSIVQRKLGLQKAFGSMAFVTSLVPGLIMTFFFAQMKLLATPLLSMPSSWGFGEGYDEAQAREQLVVLRPRDAPNVDWKKLDERITDIACPVQGLFIMKVPTFKVLTDVCKILAQDENMTVLEISSQKLVQVKVSARSNDASVSRDLCNLAGCEIVAQFAYPTDGVQGPPSTQWALSVDVPYLLTTIRACEQRGVCVDQVYDFYC